MTTSRRARTRPASACIVAATVACGFMHGNALAHGFAGQRFFPATIATDDPFVADELSLPTFSRRRLAAGDDSPATTESVTSIDYTKRITQNLGLGIGASWIHQRDPDGTVRSGFDNFAANAKYQFYKDDAREAIVSAGLDWDIGHTGAKSIGAETFSTLTPGLFFGKGFGDLPESAGYLRPIAVTGQVGLSMPTRRTTSGTDDDGNSVTVRNPNVARVGLAFEYSLQYLQSFVKDVGLRAPFNRLVPIVELELQKPVNQPGSGTTGTVNPGLLWAGRYMQIGIEAVIPVNSRTGGGNGVLLQLHFFMDDLFPRSLGAPLVR